MIAPGRVHSIRVSAFLRRDRGEEAVGVVGAKGTLFGGKRRKGAGKSGAHSGRADVAVNYSAGIDVEAGDIAGGIDAEGGGSLAHVCAGAGGVECGDDAGGSAFEAMHYDAGVGIEPGDGSGGVDADGGGSQVGAG